MENVENINSARTDERTVDVLRLLLSKAESGELQSIMFVDSYRDGTVRGGWAGYPDAQMIAEFERLKFDFFLSPYMTPKGAEE